MRPLILLPATILAVASCCPIVSAQKPFTYRADNYSLDLPSTDWEPTTEPTVVHKRVEFFCKATHTVRLQIRMNFVASGITPEDLAKSEEQMKYQLLSGFIENKRSPFIGRLIGVKASFEYSRRGKPMQARFYYLAANTQSIYLLRFTGLREELLRLRDQTDFIARSFHLSNEDNIRVSAAAFDNNQNQASVQFRGLQVCHNLNLAGLGFHILGVSTLVASSSGLTEKLIVPTKYPAKADKAMSTITNTSFRGLSFDIN